MNPKDKVSITEPTKGKKVNQEEFNVIMEKKQKEMRERYQREDRDGDGMSIRIRG